ncbi:hypothetical protein AK812_SmicGene49083 [Symbiodinium microadriaticum]|uniref:Uncharacterized protein n=1 Tax=Symbiodinium microadriaticum TaxID=2951 RepID=A0A1Q9EWM7_SYMMI|nr:hypothetical protein AK812_SmicGene49083 [Symbiodinium microadriaticum]
MRTWTALCVDFCERHPSVHQQSHHQRQFLASMAEQLCLLQLLNPCAQLVERADGNNSNKVMLMRRRLPEVSDSLQRVAVELKQRNKTCAFLPLEILHGPFPHHRVFLRTRDADKGRIITT